MSTDARARDVLFEDIVAPAATWSHVLKRGTSLCITDVDGGANVGAMFYNRDNPVERYNMPDTLKAQHIARLTCGNVLYSDMGRILCSITSDTVGWHDPLSGCSNAALVEAKYGRARYQEVRNAHHQNAYDGFAVELAKLGLSARDMAAPVNFFSKVVVDDRGDMRFVTGHSSRGASVELRAEMNVLVILNTCQHPMDPNPVYAPKRVQLSVMGSDPLRKGVRPLLQAGPGKKGPYPFSDESDPCRTSCPENVRGFVLTERYFL